MTLNGAPRSFTVWGVVGSFCLAGLSAWEMTKNKMAMVVPWPSWRRSRPDISISAQRGACCQGEPRNAGKCHASSGCAVSLVEEARVCCANSGPRLQGVQRAGEGDLTESDSDHHRLGLTVTDTVQSTLQLLLLYY